MADSSDSEADEAEHDPRVPALVLVHYPADPKRCGEVLLLSLGDWTLGRGYGPTAGNRRAQPSRQRPGTLDPCGPFENAQLSRNQLQLHVDRAGDIRLNNIGRIPALLNGWEVEKTSVQPGDILTLGRQAVFWCVRRTPSWSAMAVPAFGFGEAGPYGQAGESEMIWNWRQQRSTGSDVPPPPLRDRREDLPLLLKAFLDARNAHQFRDSEGHYRITHDLIGALLQRDYGDLLDPTPLFETLLAELGDKTELTQTSSFLFEAATQDPGTDPKEITRDMLIEAMERHRGLREMVWRDLGLENRVALDKLLKKKRLG